NQAILFASGDNQPAQPLILNLQGNTTLSVNPTLGTTNFNPTPPGTANSRINFFVTGPGVSLLAANGLPLTIQAVDLNNNPIVDPSNSHTLSSNAPLLFITQNGSFIDNYVTVTTSAPAATADSGLIPGSVINILGGSNGSLTLGGITLAGTPGPITDTCASGCGAPLILVQSRGAFPINFNSSYTFN